MSNLNPIYKILNKEYTVNFLHGINSPTITTSTVTHGSAAIAPTVTLEDYLNFNSWTTSYNSITKSYQIWIFIHWLGYWIRSFTWRRYYPNSNWRTKVNGKLGLIKKILK